MVHSPLTAIVGASSLMEDMPLQPEDAKDHVAAILKASELLLLLINDILDFAKVRASALMFTVSYEQAGGSRRNEAGECARSASRSPSRSDGL